MSAFQYPENQQGWRHRGRDPVVELLLSNLDGSAGCLAGLRAAGFALRLSPVHPSAAIGPEALAGAAAAIVEVAADDAQSIERFQRLAAAVDLPLIAAVYEPPLALVRNLIRAGAQDVVPLPLEPAELEATLAQLAARADRAATAGEAAKGKLVSAIKSGGGVGATSLIAQLAVIHARQEAAAGRDTCLIDLDLQFGDAAFQLGVAPPMSVVNLVEVGSRLDGALWQATTVAHASGLKLIGAPGEVLPLETIPCERLLDVVDFGLTQFGTLFVDLPPTWTDWSMSLVARSDLILLVTDPSIASLRRARRQIDLLESQGLGDIDLRILVNRHEDKLFRSIKPAHVREALGREVDFKFASDPALMRAATDQGLAIGEIRSRSPIARELTRLSSVIANHHKQES